MSQDVVGDISRFKKFLEKYWDKAPSNPPITPEYYD